jgi:hypothetical protein
MFYRLLLVVVMFASLGVAAPRRALAAPDTAAGLIELAQNLSVEVVENGPDQLWTLHVSNVGSTPIGIAADPGLLWFEVAIPGRAALHTCRLPDPLWPKVVRRRAELVLGPGERFSRRFDARFFCFDDLAQEVLVPGARLTPHFGWPHATRVVWIKGKRSTQTLPPAPPFVGWNIQAAPEPPVAADSSEIPEVELGDPVADAAEPNPSRQLPTEGLKHIVGATLALSPEYAKWSEGPPPNLEQPLQLVPLGGSDAEDERSASITVGIVNTSSTTQQIFIRRELIEYEVHGPDGIFECQSAEVGPPDHASFTNLRPRRTQSFVVRLIEMCPRGRFARPGLYEVHAALNSKHSGQHLSLDGFVGLLEAQRPALVRVRSGDRSSFVRGAPMVAGSAGQGMGVPGAPNVNGGAEGEPPPDGAQGTPDMAAPPDHEGPGNVEEAPAPEAPADGTAVE